ncbi:MAG: glycine oxidase ThiO [Bacteroidetes bacterium]|nr:MAG: glycine oxidase ThiO [Bacteroidota bacterium]
MTVKSIGIIGGGIIGLATGWQLVRRGHSVTIFERSRFGQEASGVAAGMLSADAELGFEEPGLYRASRESLKRWPAFVRALESDCGHSVGFGATGTLVVADDQDSEASLRRMYDFQKDEGLRVEWLRGEEARDLEPFLSPGIVSAVLAPEDQLVDNRLVLQGLQTALSASGGVLRERCNVAAIVPGEGDPIIILDDKSQIEFDQIVVASGAWSSQIKGLTTETTPRIRPVKGQILDLQAQPSFELKYVVRGPRAYLVPHKDGRIMVGATSEEMGFDKQITAGGIYSVLDGAWEIVPGIYDLPLNSLLVGLRPGSRDNLPVVGKSDLPGVYFATGHYRHGILHTALTSEEVALEISDVYDSPWFSDFRPQRF